jgi:glycolate oxidase FAD binding subunit
VTTLQQIAPDSFKGVAEALTGAQAGATQVVIAGAGTKPWSTPPVDSGAALSLRTTALDRILAHDPGDLTATLQAGVPLAAAQAAFAEAGQMLALDPPLGADAAATIGGIVATGDCGPLAHRYGGPRDLVVGATFALADGTIAKSGGTVIKNVAGYDVAKLMCGSFGTLGVVLSVNVRLHPRHPSLTVAGGAGDPATLGAAAVRLAALPAELDALDAAWGAGAGRLLARISGPQAGPRARRLAQAMRDAGLDDVDDVGDAGTDPDVEDPRWSAQREGQRDADAAVLHVALAPSRLAAVLAAAETVQARVVARAGIGRAYVAVAPARIAELRARLPQGAVSVLRDCPPAARSAVAQPWGDTPAPALAVMRALKRRFDPAGTCNPGTFVGGI